MIRTMLATTVSAIGLALAAPAMAQDEAPLPQMDFGTWGVGLADIDTNVDPGDNFNAYVNGKWVRENTIPADRQRFGAFDLLGEKSREDTRTLINDLVASNPAPGTSARRIVDAYNAYYDVEAIDATGLAPAQPYLNRINAASDLEELVALFEEPAFAGLISIGVGIDARNPTQYVPSVGFDGMGLPDRDYYLVDSESNIAIRESYMEYLTTMLSAAGYADAAGAASAVYAFERDVAELEWARQMLRLPQLTYNELTADELRALAGDFPIDTVI